MALTLLYNGNASDTTAIITAVGASVMAHLVICPNGGGQGVAIFKDN